MKTNCWVWILFLAVRLSAQTITTQPTNQILLFGSNATFSVAVSGTEPFTYQWQFNGTNLPNNIITTIAGNGSSNYSGDGGAATNAELNYPAAVTLDAFGNIFISDSRNNRIREISTNGIIRTVAGSGVQGFAGDGGPATNASLNLPTPSLPTGVAVDVFGNVFIADTVNNRIRKVATNGIITTVAGNGIADYSGDGGLATNASINLPSGVTVDASGTLLVADTYNGCVRKINSDGIITTVAGNGTQGYSGDGGPATNAGLVAPGGIAFDASNDCFIADFINMRVRKIDTKGVITTFAGNGTQSYSGDGGPATNATFNWPYNVAVDVYSNIFILDSNNQRIRKVDAEGIVTTVVGNGMLGYSGDGGDATNATLYFPEGMALDPCGNLFIADTRNNRIRKVAPFGSVPTLTLNNITTNNAGNYRVIITDPQGSVTSSVVTLTVNLLPSINSQPQPLAVTNGHPASFSVTADGSPSLAYQWFFNGTNLLASTNTILTVQNAFPDNAGAYTVVITNASGSITSNPAMLTVLPLGINAPAMLASGQFQFSFDTATGVNYTVQYSTNLTQWFPFVTLGGIGVPLTLTDPNTTSSQQRFYRIVLSPQ